jgi:flagellar hook-length control protein FliK
MIPDFSTTDRKLLLPGGGSPVAKDSVRVAGDSFRETLNRTQTTSGDRPNRGADRATAAPVSDVRSQTIDQIEPQADAPRSQQVTSDDSTNRSTPVPAGAKSDKIAGAPQTEKETVKGTPSGTVISFESETEAAQQPATNPALRLRRDDAHVDDPVITDPVSPTSSSLTGVANGEVQKQPASTGTNQFSINAFDANLEAPNNELILDATVIDDSVEISPKAQTSTLDRERLPGDEWPLEDFSPLASESALIDSLPVSSSRLVDDIDLSEVLPELPSLRASTGNVASDTVKTDAAVARDGSTGSEAVSIDELPLEQILDVSLPDAIETLNSLRPDTEATLEPVRVSEAQQVSIADEYPIELNSLLLGINEERPDLNGDLPDTESRPADSDTASTTDGKTDSETVDLLHPSQSPLGKETSASSTTLLTASTTKPVAPHPAETSVVTPQAQQTSVEVDTTRPAVPASVDASVRQLFAVTTAEPVPPDQSVVSEQNPVLAQSRPAAESEDVPVPHSGGTKGTKTEVQSEADEKVVLVGGTTTPEANQPAAATQNVPPVEAGAREDLPSEPRSVTASQFAIDRPLSNTVQTTDIATDVSTTTRQVNDNVSSKAAVPVGATATSNASEPVTAQSTVQLRLPDDDSVRLPSTDAPSEPALPTTTEAAQPSGEVTRGERDLKPVKGERVRDIQTDEPVIPNQQRQNADSNLFGNRAVATPSLQASVNSSQQTPDGQRPVSLQSQPLNSRSSEVSTEHVPESPPSRLATSPEQTDGVPSQRVSEQSALGAVQFQPGVNSSPIGTSDVQNTAGLAARSILPAGSTTIEAAAEPKAAVVTDSSVAEVTGSFADVTEAATTTTGVSSGQSDDGASRTASKSSRIEIHHNPTPQTLEVEQTVLSIRDAIDGRNPLRIQFTPPELGAMQIELKQSENGIVARLEVHTVSAHRTLIDTLPELQRALTQSGATIDRIDLVLTESRSGTSQQNRDQSRQESAEQEPSGRENGDSEQRRRDQEAERREEERRRRHQQEQPVE